MSSEFADTFTQPADDSVPAAAGGSPPPPFDDDGYLSYDSFTAAQFADSDSLKDSAAADSPLFRGSAADNVFSAAQSNDQGFDGAFGGGSEGPILPPPAEMEREEGFALREWRRENAVRLAEKEQREKDLLNQIIDEADEYKLEFYQKRKIACEKNKAANREKEKVFLANQEKFHAEANKTYWKAIAELIPNEVPAIEKKRGKKDQDKKPSIVVIQGPKPGKPTDLSRMRQILVKLKHSTPDHLKHAPPPPPPAAAPADVKTNATPAAAAAAAASAKAKAVAVA